MIISSPFEKVTAFTDFLIGVLAMHITLQFGDVVNFKSFVWRGIFSLLAVAAFLGAAVHGFVISEVSRARIWTGIHLSLGLALSIFMVGAVQDMWGEDVARQALPYLLALGITSFAVTILAPGTFPKIIVFEGLAMVFSIFIYGSLLSRGALGAEWMVWGIVTTILAAAVQATGKAGRRILWYFDSNGIFHLIQLVGLWLLMVGLKRSI